MKRDGKKDPADEGRESEMLAGLVRGYLRHDLRHGDGFLPAPFFVELFGNPDSGKSSAGKSLYMFLRRHKFRVKKPLEGAEEISDDIPRSSPEFNLATGAYAVKFLTHEHHMHTHDVVILDRGIFDAYGQMASWHSAGRLTMEEMRIYQEYFLSRFWAPRVTVAIALVCDPEVAIRRTQKEARTKQLGGSTTPESIARMRASTITTYEELRTTYPVHLIDTSRLSIEEVADRVNNIVLESMYARTQK